MSPLAALERSARQPGPETLGQLATLLRRLLGSDAELKLLAQDEPDASPGVLATRFAAAVGTLLTDPNVKLDERGFIRLSLFMGVLRNLFVASGFEGSDHLLRQLGAADTEALLALARQDRSAFLKACLLLSIDSRLPIDPVALLQPEPAIGALVALNLLAAKPIVSVPGQQRREQLLSAADRIKVGIPPTIDYLVILSNAWMLCSYAEQRDKHRLKAVLNEYLRRWLAHAGLRDRVLPKVRRRVKRPRMLVGAEFMQSNHVQYRYFGQYLRQLRTKFELVLLTEENQADPHARQLFDQVVTFKRGPDAGYLKAVVAQITALEPDLIFWLSVGMRHWGTALANLRLAPIQFTALGHSASTFAPTVDYYLTEEGYVGDPTLFSERLLLLPDEALVFERSPHYRGLPARHADAHPRPLRIALPSNLLKLNPRFLQTLVRIRDAAGRALQFHVFPNVGGPELLTTRQVFQRTLPEAVVRPMLAYNEYLSRLAQCDLNLSPFPFGGLHSVVDSLRLGLPVVALEGLEPHARTDSMILRRVGMPEWLVTQDPEGYVEAALRVIRDDALREQLSRQARKLEVDRLLFGDASTPLRSEVVEAVWWMFDRHDEIVAGEEKVFRRAAWGRGASGGQALQVENLQPEPCQPEPASIS